MASWSKYGVGKKLARRLTLWRERWDRSFSWKVRWRLKHDRNPLLTTVQDKLRVKDYARARGVEPVETLYVTGAPESIPFDDLPERYFIKANHGCGWNIACIDGILYRYGDGRHFVDSNGGPARPEAVAEFRLSREECIALCKDWLGRKYLRKEWAYQGIQPAIVVEAAVAQRGGGIFRVYRLFTMAGTVRAIAVGGPLFALTDADNLFFDRDWQPFRLTRTEIPIDHESPRDRPDSLADLVAAAERLGRGLDFVRVDLYDTPEGVRLGEMTVYPYGGLPGKPSTCRVFNKWLGGQWVLPARAPTSG
ncbi:MAG: ATP-grasp fold amidoligase family protein [Gallionellaceae bacterium]|nr:ATP-grasp fold amidoligase family protein [Gallionellaceae bacterium]